MTKFNSSLKDHCRSNGLKTVRGINFQTGDIDKFLLKFVIDIPASKPFYKNILNFSTMKHSGCSVVKRKSFYNAIGQSIQSDSVKDLK